MSSRQNSLALIVNPTAGRGAAGQRLPQIQTLLNSLGVGYTTHITTQRGEGQDLARSQITNGVDLVVAVGGDGTLHEVSNAVLEAPLESNTTLGLIPFGTGNDFARCVGLFGSVERACDTLLNGNRLFVDVGRIEGRGIEPRYFLVAAGTGYVSDTAATVNAGIRFLKGMPAYIYGALKTARVFKPTTVRISINDAEVRELSCMLISVSNVATTGGGMRIAPSAVCDDGHLDICLVREISTFELIRQLPNVLSGKHVGHEAVEMIKCKSVWIDSDRPLGLWIDGEVAGTTPAKITLSVGRLPMMLPS